MAVKIQLRNGTAAQWTAANPTLMQGEMGVETDTGKWKVGNGTQAWTALAYGPDGATGPAGSPGLGLPIGGVIGQVVVKKSATDYDTEWGTPTSGMTTESKSANATITLPNDKLILCNATSAQLTITLPAAATVANRRVTIKKTDSSANLVVADANGVETINGETTFALQFQYSAMTLMSNGTSWDIV